MTGMPMRLTILTPEGACFDETVTSVVAPGAKGYFCVLPGHAPMVAQAADMSSAQESVEQMKTEKGLS